MLGRREFLTGILGAGAAGALAINFGRRDEVVQQSRADGQTVSPMDYGARGDGRHDDTHAIRQALAHAFANGVAIDGGAALFAVAGNITATAITNPHIGALRLKQLNPVVGGRTLHFDRCHAVRIDRLEVDVGSDRTVGDMSNTGGLWIDGGSNHLIRNVEVFGHGRNSLIAIWDTADSVYENLIARDAQFDDPAAGDDLIQGIWLNRNSDCVLRNATVRNLTGNASYVGQRIANLRSRGIALGGNVRVSVIDADVSNVDQGIDLTGSDGNRQCAVIGGRTRDCGSVGVKLANSAVQCRVSDHVAERTGMYGFLAAGPTEPNLRFKTQDCEFVRCIALDVGHNGISYPNPSGFQVRVGDYDFDFPKGISFAECRAVDRQPRKTMKYGFYNDARLDPARPNSLRSCTSEGHAVRSKAGAWKEAVAA